MYNKGFVVSIHDNENKVLRENKEKEVFLPFESTYKIRLRNNNNRKAVAEVTIDGTSVLGPNKMLIEPNSFDDLERFCIDGDLKNGNQFKFVKSGPDESHPDVQDPSSPENGNVVVKFWLEKEDEIGYFEDDEVCLSVEVPEYTKGAKAPNNWDTPIKKNILSGLCGIDSGSSNFYPPLHTPTNWDTSGKKNMVATSSVSDQLKGLANDQGVQITTHHTFNVDESVNILACNASDNDSMNLDFCDSIGDEPEIGATVEGNQSNQEFVYQDIEELEEDYTEIHLTIKPFKQSVRVSDTKSKYCPECGIKNKYFSNFCKSCGKEFKGETK